MAAPDSPSREGLVTIALEQQQQLQGHGQPQGKGGQAHHPAHFNVLGDDPAAASAREGESHRDKRKKKSWISPYTLAVLAAIMGNILEFYDFSIYGYFAPEIGKLFFPKSQPRLRAVRTFTVFAGGFLMRPLGSLILGAIGDRFGTAAALKWSILLMTVPTVVTGCLPTYHKAGITATFLLTACRLLQGLSVGGEFMGALLHTSDHSPPGRRGLYVGMVAVFGGIGSLLGSIVSVGMRHAMTEDQLLRYGWRIPFLTGSLFGFLGIFLRTQTKALKGPHHHSSSSSSSHRAAVAATSLPATAAPTPTPPAGDGPSSSSPLQRAGRNGEADEAEDEEGVELTSSSEAATAHRPPQLLPTASSTTGSGLEPPTPAGFYKPDHAVFDIDLVEEAIHLERDASSLRQKSVWEILRGPGLARFVVVALMASLQSSHYYTQFVWMGTYQSTLAPTKIPASKSFAVSAVQHSISILFSPTWAYIADRVGGPKHRTLWLIGMLALGCVAPPALFPLAANGGIKGSFAYAVLMGTVLGFVLSGNWATWVIETLHEYPARVMTTSIAYNLGAMVGGSYPMLASALADSNVVIAPVLPTTALAAVLCCLLAYLRVSPTGVFNPKNEPDRNFPSMYNPKSVARHRQRQREKALQQRQRLLAEEAVGSGSDGGNNGTVKSALNEVVMVVEEGKIGEGGEAGLGRRAKDGIAVARA